MTRFVILCLLEKQQLDEENLPPFDPNAEYVQPPSNDLNMMEVPDEELTMNNPNIMSKTISVGPKSFVDSNQPYNKLAPPPRYYTEEEIIEKF